MDEQQQGEVIQLRGLAGEWEECCGKKRAINERWGFSRDRLFMIFFLNNGGCRRHWGKLGTLHIYGLYGWWNKHVERYDGINVREDVEANNSGNTTFTVNAWHSKVTMLFTRHKLTIVRREIRERNCERDKSAFGAWKMTSYCTTWVQRRF